MPFRFKETINYIMAKLNRVRYNILLLYGRLFLRYFTFRKFFNFLFVTFQAALKTSIVRGFPFIIYTDPGNICNLRCPLCPTGVDKQGRPKGMMKFETFKKIIDELGDYLFFIRLYNWGEPFLNKNIFKMIEYAHERKIGVIVNSNFNVRFDESNIEKIFSSGLDYLMVSCDGISQEIYSKYRIKGNFYEVVSNMEKLIEEKRKRNTVYPIIEWGYIVMKHNEEDIPKAKEMAKELGVNAIQFYPVLIETTISYRKQNEHLKETYLPQNRHYRIDCYGAPLSNKTCSWLWQRSVINYDGSVSPCCAIDDISTDFGNIVEVSFKDIWNNEMYQSVRSLFNKRKKFTKNTVCSYCWFFENKANRKNNK